MENIDTSKNVQKTYVESSQYYIDINAELIKAKEHIFKNLDVEFPIVILDIDQTAIDQYEFMLQNDFAWTDIILEQSYLETNFPVMRETLFFFNDVIKYVPIVFLTSRREMYRENTEKQLDNAGYKGNFELIMRPDDDVGTIQNFKTIIRKSLIDGGNTIIANIGDQDSDLDGGYPDRVSGNCFKLPNYFYLITSEM